MTPSNVLNNHGRNTNIMSMDVNAPRAMSTPSSEITPFEAICHTASPANTRIDDDVRMVRAACFTAERAASRGVYSLRRSKYSRV